MRRFFDVLHTIFILPLVYIVSVIIVVTLQTYNYFQEKWFLKKLCKEHGHIWKVKTITRGVRTQLKCSRCGKTKWENLTDGNWNE